ncbi:hypothetical protein [uncultured Arsenicicoccus sp.]|uniref:hypothetical protein n=1 Tax=uncultured Arsenicicoccus sp. TaxID=491339 RepID=UPI00259350A8|nr:hypothetical protein [uncultured Arsenicicoccus sp.]
MSTQTPTQSTPSTHGSSVPSPPGAWRRLADAVTSRRGAWATLVLALLVTTALMGALRGAEIVRADETLPPDSESAGRQRCSRASPAASSVPSWW